MGDLTQDLIDKALAAKKRQNAARKRALDVAPTPVPTQGREDFDPSVLLDIGGAGLRYLDRAARIAGLGVGTALGGTLNQLLDPYDQTFVGRWLPDAEDMPEAVRAFNRMRQQGDWDAAIEAYQDEFEAGPGFWGAAEIAGAFIPTGGPALGGARLLSAAPKLAGTLARAFVPATRGGVRVKRGIEAGLRGVGRTMRAPWELEEAVGRGALKGLGLAGRGIGRVAGPVVRPVAMGIGRAVGPVVGPVVRTLAGRFRRPAAEAVEEAVTPPGGILQGLAGAFEGLGRRFVAPLRNLVDMMDEVKTIDDPIIKNIYTKSGLSLMNPSVARGTTAGRATTAYARQLVAVDELSDTAVAAALDVHAQRWLGRIRHIIPIDKDGYFGQTGKLWNDVFSNPSAYKLTTGQREYIDDYIRLMDDVEEMRVAAGLKPRAKTREEGWFYIPRQVTGKGDVELTRPSNANLQRLWNEATEALETKGTRYLIDPRETALIHIRAAYKEVLDKQLSDVLEPISIRASEIVSPVTREAMLGSIAARKAAEREVRRLRVPRVEKPVRGQRGTRVTPEEKALRNRLGVQRRAAKARLDEVMETYWENRTAYTRALSSAKSSQAVPGKLFGPNQPDNIAVGQWRDRFFRTEDYKALVAGIGKAGEELSREAPNVFWRGFQVLGNTIRFLASVGDFAMPLIHGLPLLARNPVAWGRMALRHHQAFFDPTVQARLIRDNLAEYQWLARNGVPIGDPEFFAALAPGQGIPLGKITGIFGKKYGDSARNLLRLGGKQSFGRFQSAYNVGLGYSRVQILKARRGTWRGTDAELAQYIRNMTGGLDSRALGVRPSQRSIEGMFLAFSPRLLRSTIALVADASRPWTPQGAQALQSLAYLVGGVMGVYTLSGLALGKSWDEIREGLNPLSGRRFLSHNINGDWIGVGGQIRSLTQFMATMYATLAPEQAPGGEKPASDLLSASQFDNPLIQFYMSRGAPGISMVAGVIEGYTDLNALPYDAVDGTVEVFKHLGTSALPFASQLLLEGGAWSTVGAETVGFRGGVDLRDRKSQEMFGQEYRHVEPFMQRMLREIVPGDVSKFDRIEQERRQRLLELQGEVLAGRFKGKDKFAIWQEVREINFTATGARGEVGRDMDFEPTDVDEEDPGIRALNQQYALFDDPEVVSEETGRLKHIMIKGKRVTVFSVELGKLEAAWTEEQKKFILRNTNTQPIPMELVAALPDPYKASITASQEARETAFTDQGRFDLAVLSRRLFSLTPEPGGR